MREVVVFLPLQVVCTQLVGRSSSGDSLWRKSGHDGIQGLARSY